MAQDIDLSQFHGIFFEECREAVETMESGLIGLRPGEADSEKINTIFRAAHSIKGSAGTFGFNGIAEITHSMESVLEKMRAGKFNITEEGVSLLLEGVDSLRDLIERCKDGGDGGEVPPTILQQKLASLLEGGAAVKEPVKGEILSETWQISLRPHENFFHAGNEPLRLLDELGKLGDLQVQADVSKLPDFIKLDPQKCYFSWNLRLKGKIKREKIEAIFAWAKDECELEIKSASEVQPGPADAASTGATLQRIGKTPVTQEAKTLRVETDKLDDLVNLVGELVITQSILTQACADLGIDHEADLYEGLEQLDYNIRALWEQTINIRMLPINYVFRRLPRIVRDLSHSLGKKIELKISGQSTELDKGVLEKIADPLIQLAQNALSHGIETPEQRRAKGKEETGVIAVNAYHRGGNIVVEVNDDGAGLDNERIIAMAREKGLIENRPDPELSATQIQRMIFLPGLSTAKKISDVSGRGVGMDVVKRNITDLGGNIEISSTKDKGTTLTIILPLTLAILEGQMMLVGKQIYVLPMLAVIESVRVERERVNYVTNRAEFYYYRNKYLPIIRLHEVFGVETETTDLEQGLLIIADADGKSVGLFVEDIVGQQQVVIKSLRKNFLQVQGLAGATILGDGSVALIIDLPGLIKCCSERAHNGDKPDAHILPTEHAEQPGTH